MTDSPDPTRHLAAERDVRALLDTAERALRDGDWPRYAALWAHEPWIELLHPAQGEWLTGWETIGPGYRALLESGARPDAERHRLEVRVAPSADLAWAVADTVVRLPERAPAGTRLWITYVLERRPDGWRLVHGHVSVPASPPDEDASPEPA